MPAARALTLDDDALLGVRRGLPLAAKFWSMIRMSPTVPVRGGSHCWEWCGPVDANGNPRMIVNKGAWAQARRIAWTFLHGPLADGETVYLARRRGSS